MWTKDISAHYWPTWYVDENDRVEVWVIWYDHVLNEINYIQKINDSYDNLLVLRMQKKKKLEEIEPIYIESLDGKNT